MNKRNSIVSIGLDLIASSENIENFSRQRGIINEMFPFIHYASEKMSCRAISRFLEESHGIKLGYVTISKSLKTPEKYWNELAEDLEPSLRFLSDCYSISLDELLQSHGKDIINTKPTLRKGSIAQYEKYEYAKEVLELKWFSYPEQVRNLGIKFITFENSEDLKNE